MQCEICNARLKRGQRTLCSSCRQTITRLLVIQAAQHPARAADPAPPPPGAHPDLLARVFPDEQSSSATAPNPYWEGSALAAMFNVLSDGKWHSLATLRNMFPVDVDKRLLSIRRRGEQEAVWDLQISQDHVRLATKK